MPSPSHFKQSRPISTPQLATSTIALLHDHSKVMRCQPQVGEIEKLPSPPDLISANVVKVVPEERSAAHDWFRQIEHVSFLCGLIKKKIILESWFKDLPTPSSDAATAAAVDTDVVEAESEAGLKDTTQATEGGVTSKVYVQGMTISATWRVEKRRTDFKSGTITKRGQSAGVDEADAKYVLVEETEMNCSNVFIKWLSVGQHRKVHKKMLDNIVHEANKRAYVPEKEAGAAP